MAEVIITGVTVPYTRVQTVGISLSIRFKVSFRFFFVKKNRKNQFSKEINMGSAGA